MKNSFRFFVYVVMTLLLIVDLFHFTTALKFLTCLTFAMIVLIEYMDRARTNETLSRLGLEMREGNLYFEYSARQISFYDVITLKKGK